LGENTDSIQPGKFEAIFFLPAEAGAQLPSGQGVLRGAGFFSTKGSTKPSRATTFLKLPTKEKVVLTAAQAIGSQ
jgi:hypothetical protein